MRNRFKTVQPATRSRCLGILAPVSLSLGLACEGGAGQFDAEQFPVLRAAEQQRLGSTDDPDFGFSSVAGLDVDRDGNLYVGEGGDAQIRVYSPDGRLLRRIGREGEGPGEFRRAPRFGVVNDTVWAFDYALRRITLFTREGALLSTGQVTPVRIPTPTCYGYVLPESMRPDGRFTSRLGSIQCSRNDPPSGVQPGDSMPVPRVLFDATGTPVDTLGWDASPDPRMVAPPGASQDRFQMIQVGTRRLLVPDPPTDLPQWIYLPDGTLILDAPTATDPARGTFSVTRVRIAGDTVYRREFAYRPVAYTAQELDAIALAGTRGFGPAGEAEAGSGAGPQADAAAARALRAAMNFPEFRPWIGNARLDADGRLWIPRDDTDATNVKWLILDAMGLPLGHLEISGRPSFLWSRGDVLWVSVRDEFDVPWLVRYRVEGWTG
jgi:hypothetical protein